MPVLRFGGCTHYCIIYETFNNDDCHRNVRPNTGTLIMARRLVDLSIYLENAVISDPSGYRQRIECIDHWQSVSKITKSPPPSGCSR